MNHVRLSRGILLACASIGIAATVLKGGSTANTKCQLQKDLSEDSTCDIQDRTDRHKLMLDTKLIIWDEAPMMHRFANNAVDKMFRSVKQVNKVFGGVTVVFMGDWWQTLPFIPMASKEQKIAATLLFADCWTNVQVLRLTQNLRVKKQGGNLNWSYYLKNVGEGKLTQQCINGIEYCQVPNSIMIESGYVIGLLKALYPNLSVNYKIKLWMYNRAIICPNKAKGRFQKKKKKKGMDLSNAHLTPASQA